MNCPIFISYSRQDKEQVKTIVDEIETTLGINCWIDLNGIESGDQFEDRIIKAIDEAEIVLFMLSNNSMNSEYAKMEVNYAKNIEKKIIPIVIDGGKLRGWFLFKFGGTDYIDVLDESQKNKLFGNLRDWLGIVDACSRNSPEEQTAIVKSVTQKPEQISTNYPQIYGKLSKLLPSLLPWCDEIGEYKKMLISKGQGLYTMNGSAADYLYIIDYYNIHREELPTEAKNEMKVYKEKYGIIG